MWSKPNFGLNVLVIVLSDSAGALHAILLSWIVEFLPRGKSTYAVGMQNTCIEALFIELRMLIFLDSPALSLTLSLVGSVFLGDPSCSASSPGGHLVDGLPPAADLE